MDNWNHANLIEIWISLGPIIILPFAISILFIMFLFLYPKNQNMNRYDSRPGSRILGKIFREFWFWIMDPLKQLLIKKKITPNQLTFTAFIFSILTGLLYFAGWIGAAGWLLYFGSTFDIFDGMIARANGTESESGAFFDSTLDRFAEAIVWMGIAGYFKDTPFIYVALLGLVGSQMVSYTRARAESIGIVCRKGLMQRPERVFYLGLASIFNPLINNILIYWGLHGKDHLFIFMLCLLAVGTNATAVSRILYVMKKSGGGTIRDH